MKINHEQTKVKILDITKLINKQFQAANTFKEAERQTLNNEMLSQKAKTDRIEQLRNTYLAAYEENKTGILDNLNAIRDIEAENEKILELDVPEFANTLAACSSGSFPMENLDSLLKNFAGQRQVLLILRKSLGYEGYGDEFAASERTYFDMFNNYVVDIDKAIEKLKSIATNLEQSPDSGFTDLSKLYDSIISFGEYHGITFTEDEKTSPISKEEIRELNLRRAMGLM